MATSTLPTLPTKLPPSTKADAPAGTFHTTHTRTHALRTLQSTTLLIRASLARNETPAATRAHYNRIVFDLPPNSRNIGAGYGGVGAGQGAGLVTSPGGGGSVTSPRRIAKARGRGKARAVERNAYGTYGGMDDGVVGAGGGGSERKARFTADAVYGDVLPERFRVKAVSRGGGGEGIVKENGKSREGGDDRRLGGEIGEGQQERGYVGKGKGRMVVEGSGPEGDGEMHIKQEEEADDSAGAGARFRTSRAEGLRPDADIEMGEDEVEEEEEGGIRLPEAMMTDEAHDSSPGSNQLTSDGMANAKVKRRRGR